MNSCEEQMRTRQDYCQKEMRRSNSNNLHSLYAAMCFLGTSQCCTTAKYSDDSHMRELPSRPLLLQSDSSSGSSELVLSSSPLLFLPKTCCYPSSFLRILCLFFSPSFSVHSLSSSLLTVPHHKILHFTLPLHIDSTSTALLHTYSPSSPFPYAISYEHPFPTCSFLSLLLLFAFD
jgi:hypothetical protein